MSDTLVSTYHGAEVRIGTDGWHYATKLVAGIRVYLRGAPGTYRWSVDPAGHATFYGPSSTKDAIDAAG